MAANQFKRGLRCSSACQTKDHRTFGECMRSKHLNLNPNLADTARSKQWDADLQYYRDARSQGIQPDGTTREKVRQAVEFSDATGVAYGA